MAHKHSQVEQESASALLKNRFRITQQQRVSPCVMVERGASWAATHRLTVRFLISLISKTLQSQSVGF